LAQLICKDDRVTQFFNPIIWVCVSDNFDTVEIIIKILEVITNERPTVQSLASLQEILKGLLITKKFLLVLDDVWNDANRMQWENLVASLKFGHTRSRILVTSRMESVADMVAKVFEGEKKVS
jgi:NB-ARC domain